ncbi:hypothetical protein [Roseococcus microcysteis]|uniref:hypothetical protein n=1 Tax=Roseococcus microcysteis TaxID=2771361 RepID=UPI00168AB435|nr:hypothetical protein [Roseococcus microcysteis]
MHELYAALAALAAFLVALVGAWAKGKRDGATQAQAQAARKNQERTHAGNEAARAAERDGAAERMQRGDY